MHRQDTVRSNMYARVHIDNDYSKFWRDIRKPSNDRSTLHASSVGGCNGDSAVTEIWQMRFKQLYRPICIHDSDVRDSVLQCISDGLGDDSKVSISAWDVSEACSKQKCGKAIGLDGIAMEAFMYGGYRLRVHLSMLFNMFVRCGYVLNFFVKSVIVQLKLAVYLM